MNRISEHPVLGTFAKGRSVVFRLDGRAMEGCEGEPIAAALRAAGVLVHRQTARRNEPRGVFCAIGRCTDCVMVVDGRPNVRTCVEPLREGMQIQTQYGLGTLRHEGAGS
ncbi:MAG: (2Fe-2S)-binding protein [Desulfovibrionales bacterium]|nr:MAG: (2Fe-2S)-binding protein [Desulfovibrionales bacterium]